MFGLLEAIQALRFECFFGLDWNRKGSHTLLPLTCRIVTTQLVKLPSCWSKLRGFPFSFCDFLKRIPRYNMRARVTLVPLPWFFAVSLLAFFISSSSSNVRALQFCGGFRRWRGNPPIIWAFRAQDPRSNFYILFLVSLYSMKKKKKKKSKQCRDTAVSFRHSIHFFVSFSLRLRLVYSGPRDVKEEPDERPRIIPLKPQKHHIALSLLLSMDERISGLFSTETAFWNISYI